MDKKKVLMTVGIATGASAVLGVLAYIIHKNVFFGGRDKYGVGDVDAWRNGFYCPWGFDDDEEEDFEDFDDLDDLDEEDEPDEETSFDDFDDDFDDEEDDFDDEEDVSDDEESDNSAEKDEYADNI